MRVSQQQLLTASHSQGAEVAGSLLHRAALARLLTQPSRDNTPAAVTHPQPKQLAQQPFLSSCPLAEAVPLLQPPPHPTPGCLGLAEKPSHTGAGSSTLQVGECVCVPALRKNLACVSALNKTGKTTGTLAPCRHHEGLPAHSGAASGKQGDLRRGPKRQTSRPSPAGYSQSLGSSSPPPML